MAFISNDLILAKMLYINTDRFGNQIQGKTEKYTAVIDINGYLRPVPPEIENVGKILACPQENGS